MRAIKSLNSKSREEESKEKILQKSYRSINLKDMIRPNTLNFKTHLKNLSNQSQPMKRPNMKKL